MSGGSYRLDPKTGKTTRVERPTAEHPQGNRARPAEDAPAATEAATAAPATTPARKES